MKADPQIEPSAHSSGFSRLVGESSLLKKVSEIRKTSNGSDDKKKRGTNLASHPTMQSGLAKSLISSVNALNISRESQPHSPDKRFKRYFLTTSESSSDISNRPFKRFLKIKPTTSTNLKRKNHEPQLLVKLTTIMLTRIYQQCNPAFEYKACIRPRRSLSKPCEGVSNGGHDNRDANLIMYANDILHSEHGPFRSFRVEEMLGKGTFGQVVKAEDLALKKKVAVKVIKNKPAYFRQAAIEIQILTELNQKYDPNNEHSIVRLFDHFQYKNHLCLVFEMLSVNLYELIKQNKFRGLSCNLVRTILKQILKAMDIMYRAGIIHCDLKPENILLSSLASAKIKLIDFGSACTKNQTIYSYIQSRFYRSPEVLLGLPYDMKIDIWSIGCVAAELFLGLPLFPGVSAFNQIFRIVQMLGVPINLCRRSKKAHLYFDHDRMTDEYAIKSIVKYAEENHLKPVPPKEYFKERTLDGLIRNYPYRTSLSVEDIEKERETRMHFIDLLLNLLQLDPERRIRPSEALSHQFITGIKCNTRKESAHDFSPKKRTLGFNVPAGQGIFEHSAPEQGNYNHSALDQGVYKRSALVPMANSRPVPFHTATRYQHGFKVPRVEMKQHEVNSRYHSHPIMINLKQISLGSELADHPPFNHTPVLRAGAHSHSLTMASTPLGGSPVGLYTSHAFSPNHSWKHGSPVHGNHLHNNRLAVSPARGDTKGSPGRGVWIPGPRLHYRQQNLIHTGTSDVMYYGSPERNELKIHPHSWGHNHASMLGYQCGQSAGGYGASQPSFRDPLEDDVNPLNIGAFPAQQDRRFSRSSSFGLRPQSNTSPGVIHHSYHNRRPQHLQHRPRHHHHSPFKKFQPPLRNLIRSNHSHKGRQHGGGGIGMRDDSGLGAGKNK